MLSRRAVIALLSVPLFHIFVARAACAQSQPGCTSPAPAADGNLVLRCRHITIEIEAGAVATLIGRDRHGEPGAVNLQSGAIYIDDHPADGAPFQVRTPDAIASVRGTSWAVDVGGARSSVFVVAGKVQVRRRLDEQRVRLAAGDGVDVEAETSPLVVLLDIAKQERVSLVISDALFRAAGPAGRDKDFSAPAEVTIRGRSQPLLVRLGSRTIEPDRSDRQRGPEAPIVL